MRSPQQLNSSYLQNCNIYLVITNLHVNDIPVVPSNASTQSSRRGGVAKTEIEATSVGFSHWLFPELS